MSEDETADLGSVGRAETPEPDCWWRLPDEAAERNEGAEMVLMEARFARADEVVSRARAAKERRLCLEALEDECLWREARRLSELDEFTGERVSGRRVTLSGSGLLCARTFIESKLGGSGSDSTMRESDARRRQHWLDWPILYQS